MSAPVGGGMSNAYLGSIADMYGYGDPQQRQDSYAAMKNMMGQRITPRSPFEIWKDDFERGIKDYGREQDALTRQRTRIAAYAASGIFFLLLFEGYLAYFAS